MGGFCNPRVQSWGFQLTPDCEAVACRDFEGGDLSRALNSDQLNPLQSHPNPTNLLHSISTLCLGQNNKQQQYDGIMPKHSMFHYSEDNDIINTNFQDHIIICCFLGEFSAAFLP